MPVGKSKESEILLSCQKRRITGTYSYYLVYHKKEPAHTLWEKAA